MFVILNSFTHLFAFPRRKKRKERKASSNFCHGIFLFRLGGGKAIVVVAELKE
jgi:hypothetical protein